LSERWWRRKRSFETWFGDFFEESDRMEKMMDNMIRQALVSSVEREKARRYYAHQFGVFSSTHSGGSQASEQYEQLIDLLTDETSVIIVAELRGIDKESIKVDATEEKVTISVVSPKRKYYRELNLPASVDPKSSAASYKNGVLEVRLKKLVDETINKIV